MNEVVDALDNTNFFKEENIRDNSFSVYEERYNAYKNYKNLL